MDLSSIVWLNFPEVGQKMLVSGGEMWCIPYVTLRWARTCFCSTAIFPPKNIDQEAVWKVLSCWRRC